MGTAIAKVIDGDKHGNKALIYGALAASLPDLDTLLKPFFSPIDGLLIHRGLSHSLALMVVVVPIVTAISLLIDRDKHFKYTQRLVIVAVAWLSHLTVDVFNTYGTAILAPFNPERFAIDALPIVDITLVVLLTTIALIIFFKKNIAKYHRKLASVAIAATIGYIAVACMFKFAIERNVKNYTNAISVYTSPLPVTICQWKYVAEFDTCYQVGLVNIFNLKEIKSKQIIPKNHNLLKQYEQNADWQKLKCFTKGYYSVLSKNDGWLIFDLRFASMVQTYPEAHVLTFNVKPNDSNGLYIKPSLLKRSFLPTRKKKIKK